MNGIDEHPEAPLPHLETFSKAAELGSFTGAAREMGLSQAAVSQRIQALEQALGVPLFQRRGGRVLPTEAGRMLYVYARRILDLHQEARREVVGHRATVGGDLLLAASSIPGEHLLPALVSQFGKKYPHVRVHASVSDSTAVLQQVERGEVSLGMVGRRAESPHLESRHLASDRMLLIVPPGHAWGRRKRVSVEQLRGQLLILREAGERKFPVGPDSARRLGYDAAEIDALPPRATESFAGVGNPLALGALRAGEVVLDLGCGAGMDCLLAAGRVGPTGRVIGVDTTGPMVEKARANALAAGVGNAEFHLGEADHLPFDDGTVDVVISNGVFNLCSDKPGVLAEVFRVLRAGGRLKMADILLHEEVTPEEVAARGGMVGLNRRRGVGAVAPADVDRGRVRRAHVPRLDGLLHVVLHAGRADHRPQAGRSDRRRGRGTANGDAKDQRAGL